MVDRFTVGVEEYTPRIVLDEQRRVFAQVLVELKKCPVCDRPMFPARANRSPYDPWPMWYRLSAEAQARTVGWPFESEMVRDKDNDPICEPCVVAGKSTFACSLCQLEQTVDQVQQAFGAFGRDYLCKTCYSSVTAQRWEQAVGELEARHRYDWQ